MSLEQFFACISAYFPQILEAVISYLDLLFINTSVFFFANTYLQSRKAWQQTLEETTPDVSKWGEIVSYVDHPDIIVTKGNLCEHPNWMVDYFGKKLTIEEYRQHLEHCSYNRAYEVKQASEAKDRCAVVIGSILLVIGSYLNLFRGCKDHVTAIITLLVYVVIAVSLVSITNRILNKLIKVRVQPDEPESLR